MLLAALPMLMWCLNPHSQRRKKEENSGEGTGRKIRDTRATSNNRNKE
jgi:hypothetical protein